MNALLFMLGLATPFALFGIACLVTWCIDRLLAKVVDR